MRWPKRPAGCGACQGFVTCYREDDGRWRQRKCWEMRPEQERKAGYIYRAMCRLPRQMGLFDGEEA